MTCPCEDRLCPLPQIGWPWHVDCRQHHPADRECDERAMAAEYDRARGYDRPRSERSREAREMSKDAPIVRWPPATE